ncbi:MAG TPA: dethiobiotin synthase [Thermoleophilaceae bacterium]
MHGVVTIGTAAGVAEIEVAAGICAAAFSPAAFVASAAGPGARGALERLAEASGTPAGELAERLYDAAAPPVVAARLAGTTLSPEALLAAARRAGEGAGVLVVATSGGLIAPITERYSNRDLARELGLPVVLAAPAGEGMAAHALLTLESALGSGLAVAAIVIAGWPETPGRVLLEERELLERSASVPVLTAAAAGLPVEEWLAASVDAAPAQVTLEPYAAWESRPVGDPRATPRASIMEAMLEIVGTEGPMTASRAYSLYNRASGGRKLTSVARAPLSSSIYWLAQERRVVLVRKDDIPWQDDDVVRMPDSPAVRVRELGPRALEEVPLDEIAELIRRLRSAGSAREPAEAKRAVLSAYGLVRLTSRADDYLGLALGLADGTGGDE